MELLLSESWLVIMAEAKVHSQSLASSRTSAEKGILLQEPERASHKQQEQQTMRKAAWPSGSSQDHHSFPRFTSAHAFGCKNEVGQEEKRGPDSGSG